MKLKAEETVKKNSEVKFSYEEIAAIEKQQSESWDKFYGVHQNRFFKDRHWLFTEFNELSGVSNENQNDDGLRILELGSGVGNSKIIYLKIFPMIF